MSAGVKPLPERRIRVAIRVADAARAAELRTLLAQAGMEVVAGAEEADVVMHEASAGGFAPLAESELATLLTAREMEVLVAIGEGLTNKAIARRLGISLHTVKFHVESLFRKLGAKTRPAALAKAAERRLDV